MIIEYSQFSVGTHAQTEAGEWPTRPEYHTQQGI